MVKRQKRHECYTSSFSKGLRPSRRTEQAAKQGQIFSSSVLGNHDVHNISKIIIYMTRQLIFEQLIYQLLHFRFETNRGSGKQTDTTVIIRRLDFVAVHCILEEITRHGSWRLRSQRSHEEVVQYHSKVHDVRSEALRISRSSRMSEIFKLHE